MSTDRFYITTAIDYPNSLPHMGHAYEKVVADFYARAERLRGKDVWLLIGLDEHGQKIQEAADEAGQSPQAFVDEKAKSFRELYDFLEISYDDFIRTSEPRHRDFVTGIYEKMRARGDIYKGVYRGDYCVSCERAYTKSELADGKCPVHGTETRPAEEESYFFRLSKYRDAIRRHIEENPGFIHPAERRNEILRRLGEEVLDLSISRSTFRWGIPLPDDPSHVLYVWIDALSNYISALCAPEDRYARYWPADCHVIGKDIIWFHAVIWPAMLLSADHSLPRQVYVHGFILDKDGRKMSKHLGNVVDPLAVAREYSVDVMRCYFLKAFSSGVDGNFSLADLEERYKSELGNDLGNLVLRIAKLGQSKLGGTVRTHGSPRDLPADGVVEAFYRGVSGREHNRSMEALWAYIREINEYLTRKEPWKVRDRARQEEIIGEALEALRAATHLLSAAMPKTAASIAASLGFQVGRIGDLGRGPASYQVTLGSPLFPRREKAEAPARSGGEAPQKPQAIKPAQEAGGGAQPGDPFAALELRIGVVEEVIDHPNADTLFAMTVRIGDERRSVCAGLRKHLTADDLRGKKVLVIANLKPVKLRGIDSRGMVLATDRRDGKVVPVDPGDSTPGELVTVEGIESRPKAKITLEEFERAPLVIDGGVVAYAGKPLTTSAGPVRCDAEDGAKVR